MTSSNPATELNVASAWTSPSATPTRTRWDGGGQLIASGRLPVQSILAALEATADYDR